MMILEIKHLFGSDTKFGVFMYLQKPSWEKAAKIIKERSGSIYFFHI